MMNHTDLSPIKSICLPHVLPETSKETIISVLQHSLNIGKIVAIDMIPRTHSGTTCDTSMQYDKFLVFVHLQWNLQNPNAVKVERILAEGGQVKIHYMENRFWWVRKSTSTKTEDKEASIDFIEDTLVEPLSFNDEPNAASLPKNEQSNESFDIKDMPIPIFPDGSNLKNINKDFKLHFTSNIPEENQIPGLHYENGIAVGVQTSTEQTSGSIPYIPWKDYTLSTGSRPLSLNSLVNIAEEFYYKYMEETRRENATLWTLRRETSLPDNYIF